MKTVERSQLTHMKMATGNEHVYTRVVYAGRLNEWCGIGWLDLREATLADRRRYPVVTKDGVEITYEP